MNDMKRTSGENTRDSALWLVILIAGAGAYMILATVFPVFEAPLSVFGAGSTQTATSTVVVGNAAPTVTAVTLNGGSSITLTANATTAVAVNATVSDNNGCADIQNGTTTVLLFRSGVGSSTCLTTASNLNCYQATTFTASSTCASNSVNTTTTFGVWYFADATDGSSSFSAQNWVATVIFKDSNNATGTADSTGQELLTLTALNVTTSSINYGTLSASSTSGSTNQSTTITNAGNSSTTPRLSVQATLVSGSNGLASNTTQTYSTSTFTFQGTSTFITTTVTDISGVQITTPTTTTNVSRDVFWGITIPAGTATGTYSGVNLFTARYVTST